MEIPAPATTVSNIVELQAKDLRQKQLSRYAYFYTLPVVVANNTTYPAILAVEQDADMLFTSFTGTAYGPCDANGVRLINAETDFPLAGTASPSGAGLPAVADRGISLRIMDTGSGITLTNGLIPVETLLTPGYGVARTVPQPFEYFALRNSKIQFDIHNRDTVAEQYHFICITLYGYKFK